MRSKLAVAFVAGLTILAGLVLLGLALSASAMASADNRRGHAARPGGARPNQNVASIQNEALRVDTVADAIGETNGAFVIGTTGGNPATAADDNKRLMEGFSPGGGSSPESSFTSIRVVTGAGTTDYNLLDEAPFSPATVVGDTLVTVWTLEGLRVEQRLALVNNVYTGRADTTRIEYILTNTGGDSLQAGVRVMLDVMIGGNNIGPFLVPGVGAVEAETEFLAPNVPVYWRAFEPASFAPGSLQAQGILGAGGATPPDRFVLTDWAQVSGFGTPPWDYTTNPGTDWLNSAHLLYWNPAALSPGASRRVVTFYGLAGDGGGQTWLDSPVLPTCADLEFSATQWLVNNSPETWSGGSTTISLPAGVSLAAGQQATQSLGDIAPGQTASATWRLVANPNPATGTLAASANFSAGSGPLSASKQLTVPDCANSTPTPSPTSGGGGGTPAATETSLPGGGARLWAKRYGGGSFDSLDDVAATNDGGFVVAGSLAVDGGLSDAGWVMKLNSSGNIVWQKQYGGTESDTASAVIPASDGGYLVVGDGYASDDLDADTNAWALKLDEGGSPVWRSAYGGSQEEAVADVAPSGDGGYVLAGSTYVIGGGSQAWLLKINASGNIVWQKAYGEQVREGARFTSIAATPDGGYVAAGAIAFPPEGIVLKLDSAGAIQWQQRFAGGTDLSAAVPVAGGYVVAGSRGSDPSTQPYLARLDASGAVVWQNRYSYSGERGGFSSLVATGDGGVVAAGRIQTASAALLAPAGSEPPADGALLRVDGSGAVVWGRRYHNSDADALGEVVASSDGGYVAVGTTRAPSGPYDGWVLKVTGDGGLSSDCAIASPATPAVEAETGTPTSLGAPAADTAFPATPNYGSVQDAAATATTLCAGSYVPTPTGTSGTGPTATTQASPSATQTGPTVTRGPTQPGGALRLFLPVVRRGVPGLPPPTATTIPAGSPTATTTTSCSWTGTWSTTYGIMSLTQSGNSVSGDYASEGGRIQGTVSGNLLTGSWSEAPSYLPPTDAGDIQFTISEDCNSFTGAWRHGSEGSWGGWTGTRLGTVPWTPTSGVPATPTATTGPAGSPTPTATLPPATPCNWSGDWDTTTPFGGMRLSQSAYQVDGTYPNYQGQLSGVASDYQLTGSWNQLPSRTPPNDAGDFEWTIAADCNSFTGRWRYDSTGEWMVWNGARLGYPLPTLTPTSGPPPPATATATTAPPDTPTATMTPIATTCTWTGTWDTTYGAMSLTQSGSSVSGDYASEGGRIQGTASGNLLTGSWSEAPSYTPPGDAGDIQFTISEDCNSFTGIWRHGSAGSWAGWNGTRLGTVPWTPTATPTSTATTGPGPSSTPTQTLAPSGCDWTGTWNATYGMMSLTQSGASVNGDWISTDGPGQIQGTVSGNHLIGTWSKPGSSGRMDFTQTSCNHFDGLWNYGDGDPAYGFYGWNADRTSTSPWTPTATSSPTPTETPAIGGANHRD